MENVGALPDAIHERPFLQPGIRAGSGVGGRSVSLIGYVKRGGIGKPEAKRILRTGVFRQRRGKTRQDCNGRAGCRVDRGERSCVAHLIHRIDAVTAAALGNVQGVIEDG